MNHLTLQFTHQAWMEKGLDPAERMQPGWTSTGERASWLDMSGGPFLESRAVSFLVGRGKPKALLNGSGDRAPGSTHRRHPRIDGTRVLRNDASDPSKVPPAQP